MYNPFCLPTQPNPKASTAKNSFSCPQSKDCNVVHSRQVKISNLAIVGSNLNLILCLTEAIFFWGSKHSSLIMWRNSLPEWRRNRLAHFSRARRLQIASFRRPKHRSLREDDRQVLKSLLRWRLLVKKDLNLIIVLNREEKRHNKNWKFWAK